MNRHMKLIPSGTGHPILPYRSRLLIRFGFVMMMLLPPCAFAQTLVVNRIELSGDNMILHYSLRDSVPGRTYTVNLYASGDNFVNPLQRVSGDHGLMIKPGNERQITWNAKQELGAAYHGKIAVEVRARLYVPFIRFDNFERITRGKPKEVTWRGGTQQTILNFELYNRKGEKVLVIPNISNAGHTSVYIPPDVKAGKGYKFKIVDSKNIDQLVYSSTFVVKRKLPLLLFVIPAAAVGVILGLPKEGGDSGPRRSGIPDPEGPPE